MLEPRCFERLLVLAQFIYDRHRYNIGSCPHIYLLETSDAKVDQTGGLYHDGIDSVVGRRHNREGDLFAPFHRPY